MALLLGYVTSLVLTFLISVGVIGVFLNVFPVVTAAGHRYSVHMSQAGKNQVSAHSQRSASRAVVKTLSRSVVASAPGEIKPE